MNDDVTGGWENIIECTLVVDEGIANVFIGNWLLKDVGGMSEYPMLTWGMKEGIDSDKAACDLAR